MTTGAGKVHVNDFSIVKQIDAGSPKLIEACCTGGAGGAEPMDQVSFNFTNVDIQAADKNGKFVSQVSCRFAKGNGQIGHHH